MTGGSHARGSAGHGGRRCVSTLVASAALALGVLAHAGSAAASAGLTFDGCTGDFQSGSGCAATNPAGALDGAADVVLSQNGTQLYMTAEDGLNDFTLDGAGNPTFTGCIGDLGCSGVTASVRSNSPTAW